MNNRSATINAARTLKVVALILLLSFLLDFVILLFPFQPTNQVWQISLATALVDRGIVPMIGLGLLFAGHWIDGVEDDNRPIIDLRVPALILSSILGLLFLVIFPLHLNNVRQASAQTLAQIDQKAGVAENQLKTRLDQVQAQLNTNDQAKAALEKQKTQVKTQLTALLQNEQQYKQALNNPNTPQALKDLLKRAKANPQELDKAIAQQFDPQTQANQQLSRIREEKEEVEKQARETAWKSGLRIGISSLLLSIGYIIIGWSGLRGMGSVQGAGRKAPAR